MTKTTVVIIFCVIIAVIDLKTYRIPDILLIIFALTVIVLEVFFGNIRVEVIQDHLIASALSFFLFASVWYFTKGIGFGDVKYAALSGFILGVEKLVYAFLVTAFLGIIVYTTGIKVFKWPKTKKIPYAPFLSAGTIASLFMDNLFNKLSGGII